MVYSDGYTMKKIPVTHSDKKQLWQYIQETQAFIYDDVEDARLATYINSDGLWYTPKEFKALVNMVKGYLSQIDFDTVCGITSRAGSYGTVPLASAIAYSEEKQLLIFEEDDFGEYELRPTCIPPEKLLCDRKLVVLKDVIRGAKSVKTILNYVEKFGGNVRAVVILIDMKPETRESVESLFKSDSIILVLEQDEIEKLLHDLRK